MNIIVSIYKNVIFVKLKLNRLLKHFFKTTYKDTKKIIEQNKMFFLQQNVCRRVFVLGHSLSEIDFDYFREIRKNTLQSCEWFILAYSSDDINRALQFVDILQIQWYKIIQI
ncbi:MAG: AbiH family protein [Clostridium neonatale]